MSTDFALRRLMSGPQIREAVKVEGRTIAVVRPLAFHRIIPHHGKVPAHAARHAS